MRGLMLALILKLILKLMLAPITLRKNSHDTLGYRYFCWIDYFRQFTALATKTRLGQITRRLTV